MKVLEYKGSLIKILKDSATLMDKRILDHGERVAYIIYCLLLLEKRSDKDIIDGCMLALLHDIGAYKTDEITEMLKFESSGILKHSVYGYQFLKFCNVLPDIYDCILYHHVDYNKLCNSKCRNKDMADKLHLADKIDVLLRSGIVEYSEYVLSKCRDIDFSSYNIDLFLEANKKFNIIENILDSSYKDTINNYIINYNYSPEESKDYLRVAMYFMDFRSNYTFTHTFTTVYISERIATLMNLPSKQIEGVAWGALFHDIGKLAVPLNIVEKKGKLTEEEFEIMKTHASITRDVLNTRINNYIVEIAARHHEKIDGSGYPLGLLGHDLTMEQRILAVADILSALIGKRSYKDNYFKDDVISIMGSMVQGNKICKDVFNCVLLNYDNIVESALEKASNILDQYDIFRFESSEMLSKYCLN